MNEWEKAKQKHSSKLSKLPIRENISESECMYQLPTENFPMEVLLFCNCERCKNLIEFKTKPFGPFFHYPKRKKL